MMWRILAMSVVLGAFPLFAASPVPEYETYGVILKRNVFDASRVPYREPEPKRDPVPVERPAPPPTPKTMTLAGVFLADERELALFVGSRGTCQNVAKGEQVEGMTVLAVDSGGVRLKSGDDELAVGVGDQLSDGGGDTWSVVGQAAQAPSVQAVAEEKKVADRSELLKRLMERRKRELEK